MSTEILLKEIEEQNEIIRSNKEIICNQRVLVKSLSKEIVDLQNRLDAANRRNITLEAKLVST